MAICRNDPIQKESWVNIAPLSRGISLTSPPAELTPTWSKMAQVVPCFLRTRSSTLQFSASYQPYFLSHHGIISGFKHQPITTHKQALKMCAPNSHDSAMHLYFLPQLLLTLQKLGKSTNQPTPLQIVSWSPVISLKESHNLDFMTSFNDAAE